MRYLILFSIYTIFVSCGKDITSYPKSYTYTHLDQSEEGLFVLSSPSSAISLGINTGTYGEYRLSLKEETQESINLIFDLREIELISENMVRIHLIVDEIEIDTVVSYSIEDQDIVIEALADTDLISYDSENDQFIVCGFTSIVIPGPNVSIPNFPYNQVLVEDCIEGGNLNSHLDLLLNKNNLAALDTIGIFITKLFYK